MIRHNRVNGRMPNGYALALTLCACLATGACAGSRSDSDTTPDGFPNINVVPAGAGAQFSNADKAQLLDDLATARARQAAGDTSAATAAEVRRLRGLARVHAADALREIEAAE